MRSNAVIFWLAVLFVFSGAMVFLLVVSILEHQPESNSETVPDPQATALSEDPVTEFTLTERSGQDFSSSELEGQVWVASFFFSRCPASCTQQNLKVQELQREFGSRGVRFVSISSDPVYDTPSVLSDYARRFNADPEKWLFLTGDIDYIERIAKDMFYAPIKDPQGKPTHFDLLYAVDRAGQLHYFRWNEPEEFAQLKTALVDLLAVTPEEARAAQEQDEVPSADAEAAETQETDLEESDIDPTNIDSTDAPPAENDEQPTAEADDFGHLRAARITSRLSPLNRRTATLARLHTLHPLRNPPVQDLGEFLPNVNAALNATACVLLIVGLRFIRQGREQAHKRTMISCFVVSCVFLVSYLTRRAITGDKHFPAYPPDAIRYGYFALLISHVTLALSVPFLAITTIVLGLRDRRLAHRRLARWTYPIWMYVSVTGVLVYLMLYKAFPPRP